jgi:hypothetical protein
VIAAAVAAGVPHASLGTAGGERLRVRIGDEGEVAFDVDLDEARGAFEAPIAEALRS